MLTPPQRTWLVLLLVLAATWGVLVMEGRRSWCACQTPRAFVADGWSSHTSQHLLDPYSFSHLQHGLVFWWLFALAAPRVAGATRLVGVAVVESLWEVLENSPWIIDRYRDATAALGYTGDSCVNSQGDLLSCIIGAAIAQRLGVRLTLVLFVLIEVVMIFAIHDSLLLNVLMLVYPVEAVKQWQLG